MNRSEDAGGCHRDGEQAGLPVAQPNYSTGNGWRVPEELEYMFHYNKI